jgi:hypothetical protein
MPRPHRRVFLIQGRSELRKRIVAAIVCPGYRRAAFPERFDDVTLDDVIAANFVSERGALLATF